MSYVKTINEDGVVSDIMAKALDPTLDATILHKSELVNGFTQTTPGVNALDAAAGKSLNDSLANKADSSDLSDFETAVATNYAKKTDLSNYTQSAEILTQSANTFYNSSRRFGIRGVGVATASNEILFPIRPYSIYPGNSRPPMTIHSIAVTGFSGLSATVDTTRSDRYCTTIIITGGTFTVGRAYFCFADITV